MIKLDLTELQLNIATYIKNYLNKNNGFAARSFYGEMFTLNLLSFNNILDNKTKEILINSYRQIDKKDSEFHWEFNNYALSHYLKNNDDNILDKLLYPLTFKHTPCTNWTLLRSVTRLRTGIDEDLAINEATIKIDKFQLSSGLILDDPGVKSFQYHCFSIAMIGEIYELTNNKYFKKSFLNGVEFIRNFILSNGESLYIGRGQNQSFGYGTLIYILALAYKFTHDPYLLGDIELTYKYLKKYQREEGNFPLVMNDTEKEIPAIINMQDEQYAGWYPYNNYFDYLPFMGFFIFKAIKILNDSNVESSKFKDKIEYRDKDFIKIVNNNYEAIISRTGGYWTNDMPIPYIITKNKLNATPCYGGEQFQKSLYGIEGIPLPFCKKLNKSIRWKSFSFFKANELWIISPLGIMIRKYDFNDTYIDIETKVFSIFKFMHIYLFLDKNINICENINELEFKGYEYSAVGKLKKFISYKKLNKIRLKIES